MQARHSGDTICARHEPQAASLRRWLLLGLLLSGFALVGGASAQTRDVVVFAAASLKNALDDAGAAWMRETGKRVTISYAASNALAKQIEAGAPADLFFSADLDWMDYLASKGLIKPESRLSLLGNSLVLVAPKGSTMQVALQPGLDLAAILGGNRLAMGHVEAVPAGKYGKAALEHLGAWAGVEGQDRAGGQCARGARLSSPVARRRSGSSTRPMPYPIRM